MLILMGLFFFYRKYRTIIEGTVCEAEVISYFYQRAGRGGVYRYTVQFFYNDRHLVLHSDLWVFFFPKRKLGKTFSVWYSGRYPNQVWRRSFTANDVASLFFIAGGIAMILFV